jgi:hypothetical protein
VVWCDKRRLDVQDTRRKGGYGKEWGGGARGTMYLCNATNGRRHGSLGAIIIIAPIIGAASAATSRGNQWHTALPARVPMNAGDVRDGRGAHGRVEVFRVDDAIVPADDEKMVVLVHVGEVGHVLHRQRRVLREATNCLCGLFLKRGRGDCQMQFAMLRTSHMTSTEAPVASRASSLGKPSYDRAPRASINGRAPLPDKHRFDGGQGTSWRSLASKHRHST